MCLSPFRMSHMDKIFSFYAAPKFSTLSMLLTIQHLEYLAFWNFSLPFLFYSFFLFLSYSSLACISFFPPPSLSSFLAFFFLFGRHPLNSQHRPQFFAAILVIRAFYVCVLHKGSFRRKCFNLVKSVRAMMGQFG